MNQQYLGERGAENFGLAVFKYDKLVGELNGIETVCYSILSNNVQGFFLTIKDPRSEEEYIDLYLHHNFKTKKKVEIIDDTPYITVECKLEGRIYSIKGDTNYTEENLLSEISDEAARYIELQIYEYLYKTAKNYKTDISGFGDNALSNFTTIKEFENYNWENNYQNSFFKVNCDVCIESGYLITEI